VVAALALIGGVLLVLSLTGGDDDDDRAGGGASTTVVGERPDVPAPGASSSAGEDPDAAAGDAAGAAPTVDDYCAAVDEFAATYQQGGTADDARADAEALGEQAREVIAGEPSAEELARYDECHAQYAETLERALDR